HQFRRQLTGTQAVCEVLRLTVSGNAQQKLYFLYLAQKKLIQILNQMGYKIGFTIIEQPFILNFYQTIEPKSYFRSGYNDLNNNGKQSYRGFWIIERMDKVFSDTNFRDYRHAVSQRRKYDLTKRKEKEYA
nr:acyl-homoserine-lactone synthase [Vibrio anguillarum]